MTFCRKNGDLNYTINKRTQILILAGIPGKFTFFTENLANSRDGKLIHNIVKKTYNIGQCGRI